MKTELVLAAHESRSQRPLWVSVAKSETTRGCPILVNKPSSITKTTPRIRPRTSFILLSCCDAEVNRPPFR
jgi:hypothetical protein